MGKLMKNWNKGDRAKTSLIADVDCTADGKPLCEKVGVQGFPTIKWGDVSNLEDYSGGRDYDALKKFAKENLKPMCSPTNIDLCDDEKKATIEKFLGLAGAELDKMIEEKEKLMADAEEVFKTGVEGLQAQYQKMMEDKEKTQEDIKNSGLGLMKACKAHAASKGSDEL